ncbi:unnamed protein product [Echinostoma caproni]|uniref:Uncharacterized protein n=1 Tax=Echinostoma caproni TaxID=27848 RepID=A0A3P8EPX2_9TREM|nr:unnamed protein product [Echinostoma caproni]
MERYQHKFTKEKPFSPRTVKNNAESKLRSLRCYNPPIRARRLSTEKKTSRPLSAGETQAEPDHPQPRPNSVRSQRSTSRSSPRVTSTAHRPSSSGLLEPRNSNPSNHGQSDGGRAHIYTFPSNHQDSRYSPAEIEPHPVSAVTVIPSQTNLSQKQATVSQMGKVDQWLNTLAESKGLPQNKLDADAPLTDMSTGFNSTGERVRSGTLGAKATQNDSKNLNWLIAEHTARNEFGLTQDQLQQATDQLRIQLKISDDTPSTALIPFSSSHSWTTAVDSSTDGQAQPARSSLSGDTIDSAVAGSLGTTVTAKLVLTSLRPPPAPGRIGTGTHRIVTSRVGVRGTSPGTTLTVENDNHLRLPQVGDTPNISTGKMSPSRIEWSAELTDATAPVILSDDQLSANEHEDTLNDQLTIPNLSGSVHCTDASDIPEASPPESEADLDEFSSAPVCATPTNQCVRSGSDRDASSEFLNPRQTRVKFASEPEVLLPKTDMTTSASSLTDLTQMSSGELHNSSAPDAEPDLSSVQAIAEGDSNFSFEISTASKGCSQVVPMEGIASPRAKI